MPLRNSAELAAFLERIKRRIAPGFQKAVERIIPLINDRSQAMVPIGETRNLIESNLSEVEGSGFETKGKISYGGEAAAYAVFVHEDRTKLHGADYNLEYGTNEKRPEEQAEFLRKAVTDSRADIRQIFVEEVKACL